MNAPPPQAAPPPPPPTAPRTALDVDQLLRVEALQAAAVRLQGLTSVTSVSKELVAVARACETYLRGDQ